MEAAWKNMTAEKKGTSWIICAAIAGLFVKRNGQHRRKSPAPIAKNVATKTADFCRESARPQAFLGLPTNLGRNACAAMPMPSPTKQKNRKRPAKERSTS